MALSGAYRAARSAGGVTRQQSGAATKNAARSRSAFNDPAVRRQAANRMRRKSLGGAGG